MPISEEGRQRQKEALARARAAKQAKYEAGITNVQVPSADEMPQVVLKSTPSVVMSPDAPPGVTKARYTFVTLEDKAMTVCISDRCWTGKEFTVTDDDCQKLGIASGRVPKLDSLMEELSRQLKNAGFIFSVR